MHQLPYDIPTSDLELVRNLSGFAHFSAQKMAPGRIFKDVLVVRGTFELDERELRVASEQEPVRLADRHRPGKPASRATLLSAGDLHLDKPGADVIVTGTAHTPGSRALQRWSCSVAIAAGTRSLAQLTLEATGPRSYVHRRLGGWRLEEPAPTVEVPITYELSFGGAFTRSNGTTMVYPDNPAGVGFVDIDALDPAVPLSGPQWQHPEAPLSRLGEFGALAGLGPVARSWAARARFAGTYDAAWRDRSEREARERKVPDYAPDFSSAFFHAAHPSLRTERPLRGNERVLLHGLLAEQPRFEFTLPGFAMLVEILPRNGGPRSERMTLDTVDVDIDSKTVGLVWRYTLDPRERIGSALIYPDELKDVA
jgi:hypothetical protein